MSGATTRFALAAVWLVFAAGCGGAPQEAPAAPQPQAYPQQPMGGYGPEPTPNGAAQGDANEALSARTFTSVEEAEQAFETDALQFNADLAVALDDTSGCQRACRALASMTRSAGAICELAGLEDMRCERASARLSKNQERIRAAGCGCQ